MNKGNDETERRRNDYECAGHERGGYAPARTRGATSVDRVVRAFREVSDVPLVEVAEAADVSNALVAQVVRRASVAVAEDDSRRDR